jgi:hypothetical protein
MAEVAALLHTRRGIAKGLRNDMAAMEIPTRTLNAVELAGFSQAPESMEDREVVLLVDNERNARCKSSCAT